jgi:hypothetical protein
MEKFRLMTKISELIQKEKNNILEVEDILDLVKSPDKSILPELNTFKKIIQKNDNFSASSIPFDRWIDAVYEFVKDGYSKVVESAINNKEIARFSIGVLESSKTHEGFKSLLKILSHCDLHDKIGYTNAIKCISAINLLISFDCGFKFSGEDAAEARNLIHKFILFNKEIIYSENDLMIAYASLRQIGDIESIDIIKQMPAVVNTQNSGVEKMVMSAIRRRLKNG